MPVYTVKCNKCQEVFSAYRNPKRKDRPKYCSAECAKWRYVEFGRRLKPGLEATESPTLLQLAWAAGIFEGEGSCVPVNKSSCQVNVSQKDRWVCDRMKALFGGSITERKMNGLPFYDWHIHSARARGFLMTMFSFLSPRRQGQVKACL